MHQAETNPHAVASLPLQDEKVPAALQAHLFLGRISVKKKLQQGFWLDFFIAVFCVS